MVTRNGWQAYGSRCRRSPACSRDIQPEGVLDALAPGTGNRPASVSSRSRSPASPCTAVIACNGIVASSRFSGVLSPLSPGTSFAVSCGATVSPSRVPDWFACYRSYRCSVPALHNTVRYHQEMRRSDEVAFLRFRASSESEAVVASLPEPGVVVTI